MDRVVTVLGDIPAQEMGITYSHEHLISAPPARISKLDTDLILDDEEAIVRELALFKSLGGKTICDASAIDYGRNIKAVARVAKASGLNVIATAGFNKALYFDDWISKATLEGLAERIHAEITTGIEGTAHRAGMLKFGTSYGMMKPVEAKTARAVYRVQRETGAPLFTHTEFGTMGLEQIALLQEEKVDLERVCIGHQDRNPDLWNIRKIAGRGCFIGIDQISKVKYHTDQVRIDLIIALTEKGLQEHIMIGGDLARRSYLTAYGGGPGYGYIVGPFMERLREEMAERSIAAGTIDRVVEDLLINNPRRLLHLCQMKKAIEWAGLTWEEADRAVQRQAFAVLPLGAIEEHGPHMTLGADCRAADVFAARLAAETDCILLPTIPYGQVWSLKGFPGSLTIRTETLVALLIDLCNSLETRGFKGVVAVTGHLGNLASMKSASRNLYDAGRIPLLSLFYPGLDEIAAKVCASRRAHGSIIHADEIETSLLLAMDPQCVRMEKAVSEYPEFPADFEARSVPWDAFSKTGVFGDPTKATREKGEEMLDFVTEKAARIIASFKASTGDRGRPRG